MGSSQLMFILVAVAAVGLASAKDTLVPLNGADWTFTQSNDSSKTGPATVPGDIYTDLWRAGLIQDPLKDNNDVAYQWVGRADWTYTKQIDLSQYSALNPTQVQLRFSGLDTIAAVYVNKNFVIQSVNQFIDYNLDVKQYLVPGVNTIQVKFQSAVSYSADLASKYKARYGHYVPPDCPLPIQNGECHPNFIRKSQASFSWDWGPSYPTVGIWRDVSLVYVVDAASVKAVSPLVTYDADTMMFTVAVDVDVFCLPKKALTFDVMTSFPGLSVKNTTTFRITCDVSGVSTVTAKMLVQKNAIDLWWPNGYGQQKLYQLLTYLNVKGAVSSITTKNVGFRFVELVQDLVDPTNESKGRNFYFKVNGVPVFLKGSNLIEVENFYGRDSTKRTDFLLDSVKEANMNALRVWGGGIFESDHFYEKADENGILLWHDMLFACALYPVDQDFLSNVHNEINVQVKRLRYHPSILVWAGNNENEVAIMGGWWYVPGYSSQQVIKDYVTLYRDTIGPVVKQLDPSRPYLLSSPSNGLHSEAAGGVDNSPNSEFYGDIHFYNEFINLWKDGSYETPRCATEFGVQSFPLKDTILSEVDQKEYFYSSKTMTSRQHHTGGVGTLLSMTFSHFDHPKECTDANNLGSCPYIKNDPSFIAPFSYLTQLHQAGAMEVQSVHYRRWMGRYDSLGKGNTMCALFWQLNDVWAAPSWSSIDYNQEWKVLHYRAKNFFAPVIVSMYIDSRQLLQVYVISDSTKDIKGANLVVNQMAWTNGFNPVATLTATVDVKALTAAQVDVTSTFTAAVPNDSNDYVFTATLTDSNNNVIAPVGILHPDKFYGLTSFGDVSISQVQKTDAKTFSITVQATAIAPFVWVDLTSTFKQANPGVLFRFSDNSFTAHQASTTIQLLFVDAPAKDPTVADLTVCHVLNCFRQ